MTYEERIWALAEEMAKATCAKMAAIEGSDLTWNDAGKDEKKLFIETHMPAAQIAVKYMANAFSQGYAEGMKWGDRAKCKKYQIISGLIPDTEQYKTATAGQQETK